MPAFDVWFLPFLTCQSSLCDAYALFTIWLFLQSFHFLYTARSCFFFSFILYVFLPTKLFQAAHCGGCVVSFRFFFSVTIHANFDHWLLALSLLNIDFKVAGIFFTAKGAAFWFFHSAICQMLCKEQLLTLSSLVMLFGLCCHWCS